MGVTVFSVRFLVIFKLVIIRLLFRYSKISMTGEIYMNDSENFNRVISKFDRCDFEVFAEKLPDGISATEARELYDSLQLPLRGTRGSAGYDILAPYDITFLGGQYVTIPTGLTTRIRDGWVGIIVPRSGLGFKYGLRLANTMAVIDSDYEGQILLRLKSECTFDVKKGDGLVQMIFVPFGLAVNDKLKTENNRGTGGFGSTG